MVKIRFLGVIILTSIIAIVGIKRGTERYADEHTIQNVGEYGVLSWLDAFTNKDFYTCDDMIEDETDAFYSGQVLGKIYDHDYYNTVLEKLVGSVSSIKVESVEKSGVDTTYTLTVNLKPYVRIEKLDVDKDCLEDAKEKVLSGDDSKFYDELSKTYFKIFKSNCFQKSDEVADTYRVLSLTEREQDGVVQVYNTVDFVNSLLEDSNILNNIKVYERDVKGKLNTIIEAY